MRRLITLAAGLTVGASLAIAPPASAHGDRGADLREVRASLLAANDTPVLSGNVQHLGNRPGTTGISGCFMKTAPLFVTSGLESVRVWNVKDATNPTQVGVLPNALFENEAMNCGERRTDDGRRRFSLIGVDAVQASPNDPQHVNVGGNELIVVDVTDPAAPDIVGRAPATTSTHTVACLDVYDCRYAYSAGDRSSGTFSIIDLRNIEKPKEVDSNPNKAGVQAFRSPTAGHKWNFDNAGIGTHTGWDGSSMWDVDRPRHPRLLATTGRAGGAGDANGANGYNDFIHHNSFRPNAGQFTPGQAPSVARGNVLLVTEEDYENTDCATAGSFQTWQVGSLDGTPGSIRPLDRINPIDLGEGVATPRMAFCSAHWFDYHPSGIVAAGFYEGGLRLLDVRDARDIKEYGYVASGLSEVWDAYWVPQRNKNGVATGTKTNIVYTVDAVRGLDVYTFDLPGTTSTTPLLGTLAGAGGPDPALAVLGVAGVALAGLATLRRRRLPTH
jgi:hypothetical protein